MKSLRILAVTNFLYSFIVAALTVSVPLYLLNLKLDLGLLGLILSISPLIFVFQRIIFASYADEIGIKPISIIYSVSNSLSILFYSFFPTSIGFALGSLLEGVRASGFWAICRTEILHLTSKEEFDSISTIFSAIRQLGDAFGRFFAGIILFSLGYFNSFLSLFGFSMVLLFLSFNSKSYKSSKSTKTDLFSTIFKKRSYDFWKFSFFICTAFIPLNTFISFTLPIYFSEIKTFDIFTIGLYLALFSLISAISSFISHKLNNKVLILLIILSSIAFFTLSIFPNYFELLLLILSIGGGAITVLYEKILVNKMKTQPSFSTEIAFTVIPMRIGEFLTYFFGGFVISSMGFNPLFILSGVFILIFGIFASTFEL